MNLTNKQSNMVEFESVGNGNEADLRTVVENMTLLGVKVLSHELHEERGTYRIRAECENVETAQEAIRQGKFTFSIFA